MLINCAHCGAQSDKAPGAVNRARGIGAPLYCGRSCAGLARRKPPKSKAQMVAEKAAYDAEYRDRNREQRRAQKAAYHLATYDPAAAAVVRKRRMPKHVEYCRRPEYRAKKHDYDQRREAAKFGPFAEAWQLTKALNREVKERSNDYDIRQANQTFGKTQARDRASQGPKRERSRRDHP